MTTTTVASRYPPPKPPKRPARPLSEIIATADAEDLAALRESYRIAEEQAAAEAEEEAAEVIEFRSRTPSLDERMARLNLKPAGLDAPEPPKINGAASTASFIVAMGDLVARPRKDKPS